MTAAYDPTTPPAPTAAPGAPEAVGIPQVIDRREGPYGEVVLRRHGQLWQIIANGCFLMDTSDGRSERLLVDAALDALGGLGKDGLEKGGLDTGTPAHLGPSLLLGGLGVGFSLARAAGQPHWKRITVVERERAIIDWHRTGPLREVSGPALTDPRVEIVEADLVDHVNEIYATYDTLCLDIDNGPDWTVTEDNANLYAPAGLAACARALVPGGVLAVWSAKPSPEFEGRLRNAGFRQVRTKEIPVARGVPDVVHLAVRPG
ncbi:spermidine synthase [Streptomyces cavernae]|uniref:spermidine synthase n=1 Tax=Streptomyces cavernae TaxID=2259034 RepID=UPI000FEB702B|nr:spermidine synthase [Streptomyces cavernae]